MEAALVIIGIACIVGLCVGIWKFNEFVVANYEGYSFLTMGKIAAITLGQLLFLLSLLFYQNSTGNFYVLLVTALSIVLIVFIYNAKRTSVVLSAIGTFIQFMVGAVILAMLFLLSTLKYSAKKAR